MKAVIRGPCSIELAQRRRQERQRYWKAKVFNFYLRFSPWETLYLWSNRWDSNLGHLVHRWML